MGFDPGVSLFLVDHVEVLLSVELDFVHKQYEFMNIREYEN